MDASALSTENIVATIVTGTILGIIGVRKYLQERKEPTTPTGDRLIPGLSLADMKPFQAIADATARSAEADERIASALEKMLALSQERAEDAEIVRRAEIMAQEMLKQLQPVAPRRSGR
jgi:hypothetical protein